MPSTGRRRGRWAAVAFDRVLLPAAGTGRISDGRGGEGRPRLARLDGGPGAAGVGELASAASPDPADDPRGAGVGVTFGECWAGRACRQCGGVTGRLPVGGVRRQCPAGGSAAGGVCRPPARGPGEGRFDGPGAAGGAMPGRSSAVTHGSPPAQRGRLGSGPPGGGALGPRPGSGQRQGRTGRTSARRLGSLTRLPDSSGGLSGRGGERRSSGDDLVVGRGVAAEGGVPAGGVVEAFDPSEDRRA